MKTVLSNEQNQRPFTALQGPAQVSQPLLQDTTGIELSVMHGQTDPYNLSPLGMEPGEFMTDSDFMFLNNLFPHPREQTSFATATGHGDFSTSG